MSADRAGNTRLVMKVVVNQASLAVKLGSVLAAAVACTIAVGASVAAMALPASARAEGACPNAVFRTGLSGALPDCRAYEMVSPPYKEGYKVYPQFISADGSRMIGFSLGTFAGAEDSLFPAGAQYLFTRTDSGWVTTSIELPAWQFPDSKMYDASASLESSLWLASTPSQTNNGILGNLYLREPNGSIVDIGPAAPPGETSSEDFRYKGASSDLSHVLFSIETDRWPGDETRPEPEPSFNGGGSLYEYIGTGNSAPLLVGVSGGAGSRSLISECGTTLGWVISDGGEAISPNQQNAVSRSGATVFFTALSDGEDFTDDCPSSTVAPPVNELFARIDNGLVDAHTVAISEPSKEDCSACDTEVPAAGVFQGASVDGSKVFFTTTQPLLGSATETSTNLYEYDFDNPPGQKIIRVSAGDSTVSNPVASVYGGIEGGAAFLPSRVRVSEDGSHVYFVAAGVLTRNPNGEGQSAQLGAENLYVFERDAQYPDGRIAFIAHGAPSGMSLSADGDFAVFGSGAHLTADDTAPGDQIFEYDAQTGELVRVSIGQGSSYDDDGNAPCASGGCGASALGSGWGSNTSSPTFGSGQLTMSEDGSEVFFESEASLTPQAVSGVMNVYEYHDGNVYLISDGQDTLGSGLLFASASGADVFFSTYDQLLPQDGDTQIDFYDARVGGGFPQAASPQPCVGDGCQGALSGSPVLLSPGSEFQAGGNPSLAAPIPAAKPKPKPKGKAKAKKRKKKTVKKSEAKKSSKRPGKGGE
jgi:hypothetical protein